MFDGRILELDWTENRLKVRAAIDLFNERANVFWGQTSHNYEIKPEAVAVGAGGMIFHLSQTCGSRIANNEAVPANACFC